ncbi:MAG: mechanosensitive ion channel [Nitrospirae bacterium]|nr:mechanosensitive ion channel [Nitrospirota bacterium]
MSDLLIDLGETILMALLVYAGTRTIFRRFGRPLPPYLSVIYATTALLVVVSRFLAHPSVPRMYVPPDLMIGVRVLFWTGASFFVLKLLDLLLIESFLIRKKALHIPQLLRMLIFLSLFVTSLLFVLRLVLDINLIALIALPTVATAVVGFSLKDTLTRLFDGIALGRVMRTGDWVGILGREGQVVQIDLSHLTLRTREDDHLLIPNNSVSQQEIINYSKPSTRHACSVAVEAAYKDPPLKVQEVLQNVARSVPGVMTYPAPKAFVEAYRESGMQYRLKFWAEDYSEHLRLQSEVLSYIWYAFQRQGIEIPYPVRTIQIQPATAGPEARNDIVQKLRRVDFLSVLPDADLEILAGKVRRRSYLIGERVIEEGEPGEEFFFIERGTARVRVKDSDDPKVAELAAADFFGEISLLTGEPRSATVVAASELQVLVIDKACFQEILFRNPSLAEAIGETLSRRRADLTVVREKIRPASAAEPAAKTRTNLADRIKRFFGIR